MLGASLKVKISLISTQFYESYQEVENLGWNVTGDFGNNDSQMALAIFVLWHSRDPFSERGQHFLAFTNGFGFGYSQFVIPSINP